MNTIAKQRLQTNKESIEKNRIEGLGKEEKKEFIERNLKSLKQNNQKQLDQLTLEADEHRYEIEDLERQIASFTKGLKSYEDAVKKELATNPVKNQTEYFVVRAKITGKMEQSLNEIEFYCDSDNCPRCKQTIDDAFKVKAIDEQKAKVEEFKSAIVKINTKIEECNQRIKNAEKHQKKVDEINIKIQSLNYRVDSHRKQIASIEDRMSKIQSSDVILSSNEKELKETTAEIDRLATEKQKLLEDRSYIDTAITLLKDGGIKTKIIKQYLPIINKMINKYLLQMGFFVNFNIDENFEESIKSRYRDDFSYQSFSEGEKMKIDLAILFAWRAVAKMKNSVNTNLLLLDEIFDSSLDSNGTDEFLKIMWSLTGDTNVMVISHKQDQLIEKFQKVIRFDKVKNFSRMI
jgi:DNA repair exonuclease SbcCD ATPase subunit